MNLILTSKCILILRDFLFSILPRRRKVRMVTIIFVFYFLLKMAIVLTAAVTFCVLGAPVYVIRMIFRYCCSSFTRAVNISEKWKTELRGVFPSSEMFPEWIMRIRVEDMDKWIDLSDKSPPNHLVQLLSKPPSHPPQTLLNKLQQVDAAKGYYRLSCLSLVILVKIVALAIPLALAEPILQALDEVFELIYYIDKKINVGNFEDQRKRQFAKVLLKYKNTHLSKKDSATSHRSIREAISSIENEYKAFPIGSADREMKIIRDFIRVQEYASIEELYEDLEQLFVDMLLFFLPQLPIVIFKDASESPIEVHEERARHILKLLCKLKLLEDKVQWSFPENCHIQTLMDPEDQSLIQC
ncbi:hypothetical protein Scep_010907 [Stephania cephalantha]|uniref:Uncharacterized protein n=1 Tax=Stephania cephalantha TaxID=152367 RepID=A0AAP0JWA7_9MAGN